MRITYTTLLFLGCLFTVNSQQISGKWMQVRVSNTISYPAINIIRIKGNSIFAYDFDILYDKTKIKIKENQLILKDSIAVDFRFADHNTLEQKPVSQSWEESMPFRYVRMLPTQDNNNLAEKLKNSEYRLAFPDKEVTFKLDEKLDIDNSFVVDSPPLAADYITIRKFEDTYFLCLYALNYFTYAFPIKEIKEKGFTIYGVPSITTDLMVRKIE